MHLTRDEFRQLGYRAVDMASTYLSELPGKPVFQRMREENRQAIMNFAMPDAALSGEEILDLVSQHILAHTMGNGHPRFFGWVNSPPSPMAVITEILATAMNPSCAGGDHAAIYLEHCVIRWLMELIEFPGEGSGGLLVSGASAASITALAAARHACLLKHAVDVRRHGVGAHGLRLYASNQTHSCIQKAVELLGLGADSIRWIEVNDAFQIRLDLLSSTIADDASQGFLPFCIVGNAGTVNTGAVDPLDGLAEIASQFKLWLHVDGAYGAVGKLDENAAPLFSGLERADSVALDPHKWLSVPVECGCVLVRDVQRLRDTFSLVPPYLRNEPGKGIGNLPWFSEYGFQQTRGFRALKLWATLMHEGRNGLCSQIARHNALARYLERRIESTPGLELCSRGRLSIVCFRCRPSAMARDDEALNALNKQVMERMQSEGIAFLTNATLRGQFVLRACILHYGTCEQDIDAMLEALQNIASHIVKLGEQGLIE
jgi:aromatic-L-amino-acid/L-tryptophan decarboxylase